jgi:glycosyltransferase involved in cell wall biosynthesis
MKILYDYQAFERQRFGGVSRYFFELISNFDKDETMEWELPILYTGNDHLRTMAFFKEKPLSKPLPPPEKDYYKSFFWGMEFIGKWRLFSLRNKIFPPQYEEQDKEEISDNKSFNIERLKEGAFDIFHPTYYDDYFLDYIGTKPFVLTVYDLIHQIYPETFSHDTIDKNKELLQKANKIIAISECTKRDLVSFFDVPEDKIVVTHLANSLDTNTSEPPISFQQQLPKNFLLYVGNRLYYKNFLFFIEAFAILEKTKENLSVVCTGPPFTKGEIDFFDRLGVKEKLYHFYVDDAKLTCLYQHAEAFVFPSLYEGFGLPVLEAFSCGCPVILSNSSSLAEIGEDAVVYFEPKNISSFRQALEKVVYNQQERKRLIEKGKGQLQKFSWKKTASATKEVYDRVLSGY